MSLRKEEQFDAENSMHCHCQKNVCDSCFRNNIIQTLRIDSRLH